MTAKPIPPPPEPDDDATHRMRHRLLNRLAEESTGRHHTVQAHEGLWQPFAPGVRIKILHQTGGVMSYLLAFDPGAGLPAHRHPVDEECIVLQGSIQIGDQLRLDAGGYHRGLQGVLHAALHSETGATIFLRGAVPHPSQLV